MTLKEMRGEMTLMQAATKAKITIPTWHRLEKPKAKPSPAHAKICKAFKKVMQLHPDGRIEFVDLNYN